MLTTQERSKLLDKQTLTPAEYMHLFRLSKNTVYSALKRGDVPSVRIGQQFRIPAEYVRQALGLVERIAA